MGGKLLFKESYVNGARGTVKCGLVFATAPIKHTYGALAMGRCTMMQSNGWNWQLRWFQVGARTFYCGLKSHGYPDDDA